MRKTVPTSKSHQCSNNNRAKLESLTQRRWWLEGAGEWTSGLQVSLTLSCNESQAAWTLLHQSLAAMHIWIQGRLYPDFLSICWLYDHAQFPPNPTSDNPSKPFQETWSEQDSLSQEKQILPGPLKFLWDIQGCLVSHGHDLVSCV